MVFRTQAPVLVLLLIALFTSAPVLASQRVVTELPRAMERTEQRARAKAAKGCQAYAKWCEKRGANEEARRYFSIAAMLEGRYPSERDFGRTAGRPDDVHERYATEKDGELSNLKSGSADLFSVIRDAYKAGCDHLVSESADLWLMYLKDDALLESESWVWHSEAAMLMPAVDSARVDAGDLRVQGRWIGGEEIEKHDAAHGSFASPTILTDRSFKLHSEMPLTFSLAVMGHITRWHCHLVLEMAAEMKLRKPEGVLDIYVAKTFKSYEAKCRAICEKRGSPWHGTNNVGLYLGVWGIKLCPVVLSMETPGEVRYGMTMPALLQLLQHEVTHQILTEGLVYKETATRRATLPPYKLWVREGFAIWMEYLFWDHQSCAFVERNVRKISLQEGSGKAAEGRLWRVSQILDRMPKVQEFVRQNDDQFYAGGLDTYAQSCALVMFLVQRSAESRAKLFELSHVAHLRETESDAFEKVFRGEDLDQLDAALRRWIADLEFDD